MSSLAPESATRGAQEAALEGQALEGGWRCWPHFALRAAGFPARLMLELAAPQTAQTLVSLFACERELARLQNAALQAIDAPAREAPWPERNLWKKRRKRLRKGKLTPFVPETHPQAHEAYLAFAAAQARAQAQQEAFEASWQRERHENHDRLRAIVQEGPLLEAVLWQNRQAVEYALDALHTIPPQQENKKARQARQLALSYLQRYCTKNDTIGFFGPIGWGRWVAEGTEQAAMVPGPTLTEVCGVYFEPWAMDAYAKRWSQQQAFLLDVPPRLNPLLSLREGVLYGLPGVRSRDGGRRLGAAEARLLACCDGKQSARQVAAAFREQQRASQNAPTAEADTSPPPTVWTEAEVVDALETLTQRGWLLWTLDIPFGSHPEQALQAQLEKLQDAESQTAMQAELQRILQARDALQQLYSDQVVGWGERASATTSTSGLSPDRSPHTTSVRPSRKHATAERGPTERGPTERGPTEHQIRPLAVSNKNLRKQAATPAGHLVRTGPAPHESARSAVESNGGPGATRPWPPEAKGSAWPPEAKERPWPPEAKGSSWPPELLARGLAALEQEFTQTTGLSATRHEGQTYAGRTLVYLDCRRAMELRVPYELLKAVERPLAMVLQSARWLTYRVASRYRAYFVELFEKLARRRRQRRLPLAQLWKEGRAWLDPFFPAPVREEVESLQVRWGRLLGLETSAGERILRLDSEQLASGVASAFAAPHPGWPGARHHAPDLLFAAHSFEALCRGEGQAILGEIHAGLNTLCTLSMTAQNPALEQLQAMYREDLSRPGIAPIPAGDFARSVHDSRLATDDLHLDIGAPWSSWRDGTPLRLGDFWVQAEGQTLIAETHDGTHRFDIIELLERRLKMRTAVHFSFLPPLPHTPRILLDELVIAREQWRFACEHMDFASLPSEQERFVEAFRWAQHQGLPRFVFVKSPREVKPIFLDWQNPHLVEKLCWLIRQTQADAANASTQAADTTQAENAQGPVAPQLSFSEMLPAPEETWLCDEAGNTYTSELRLILVDPTVWHPPETT